MTMKSIAEFCQKKKPIEEVIARLVAENGLNFKQLATSELIHEAFKSYGYEMPKNPHRCRELFGKI